MLLLQQYVVKWLEFMCIFKQTGNKVSVTKHVFFWQPLVLPPSVKDNLLDFGVRSATHTSSIIFVAVNSNPIEVRS